MDGPALYEIRLQGELSAKWAVWFEGMEVAAQPDGTTVLRGRLPDQAALHGVLFRIRDLGLPLLALAQVPGPAGGRDGGKHRQSAKDVEAPQER